ncbi:MAG: NADH-quinone oxidoreductase subunit L [Anaerolineaceae bacterium]
MATIFILLTIGISWLGALILRFSNDENPRLQHTLAVVFSVASGIASLALIPFASKQAAFSLPMGSVFGNYSFVPDGMGIFLAVVAAVIGSLAVIFSVDYMKGEAYLGRYYSLVLLFIGGMAGLVLTSNLLLIFFFWEITALCSYALIAFHNDDPKAVRGGIKALVITQLGGIGLLAGSMLAYTYLGTYDLNEVLARAGEMPANMLAIFAFGFLAAAAAKSAQFPFQTWLPDAMEAPTPISALIHAATMVNAGVYLLARFYPAFHTVPGWTTTVMVVGMLSALMAAVMALVANDLKRVLAYSTISQLGYMVYAVGAGGIFAAQFHLMSHSVFKALLFLCAGAVIHSVGTRDMREMGGLGKKMPLVRSFFIIGALALAGLPVLNGFWSKELVLEAGLTGGPLWAYIIMVLVAGLTALYTFRCVWMVFYGEPRSELHAHDAGSAMRVALIPLAFGSLTTWLLAAPFANMLKSTLPAHAEFLPEEGGWMLLKEVLTTPYTLVALAVIALGILAWVWREKLAGVARSLNGLGKIAADSFGFEAINDGIIKGANALSEFVRNSQTGQLSWNVAGIAIALVAVLIYVILAV